MQEILKKYKKELCKNCIADCYLAKGIVTFTDNNTIYCKCVDYKPKTTKRRGLDAWEKNRYRKFN